MSDYKVPYVFIAGTRAKASQVNANFDALLDAANELADTKADLEGNAEVNFSVADPTLLQHAATKRYVDLAVAEAGGSGGGSGVGKSMFEVFHTLSTKTPPGALSLRTGELILEAEEKYPSFYYALQEQGTGLIVDLTDIASSALPEGYSSSFTNVTASDVTYENRAFSPYSWFTTENAPSSSQPIAAELEFPELITCSYFKINSHVINTYNSVGDPNPAKAIKTASISVRQADDTWVPVTIISETEVPISNERYFANTKPDLEFNAIRIVVAENFGAGQLDLSVYPVDPEKTAVRVVPEEQWQWEVETYHETGAFVLNSDDRTVRLPKITRFLSGVSELWQIGTPEASELAKSAVVWQEGNDPVQPDATGATVSLDAVSTGLWIQVYNAVAEDALANIKYVPHATLFEERGFRFQPAEETGWVVSDGNWKDGNYYTDAMTELLNQNAQAVTPGGKNYKLAPNGMKFVTDEVYQSTYKTYGEVPYYVVDSTTYKFKTPMSNNYARYTSTLDNTGDLLLDGAPDITGQFTGTGQSDQNNKMAGAFYVASTGNGAKVANDDTQRDDVFGFAASKSNSVYGRAKEIRPKSSYYLMCVFLGNEIPQSASVDVFQKIKSIDSRLDEIESSSTGDITEIKEEVENLKSITESQATAIQQNAQDIDSLNLDSQGLHELVNTLQDDVTALQDQDSVISGNVAALEPRIEANEQSIASQAEQITKIESDIEFIEGRVTTLEESMETKQDKLVQGTGINIEAETNTISLSIDPYSKTEVDDLVEVKADKSEVTAVDTKLGGLKFVKITKEEYDLLTEKDETTLYVITDTNTVKLALGSVMIV